MSKTGIHTSQGFVPFGGGSGSTVDGGSRYWTVYGITK